MKVTTERGCGVQKKSQGVQTEAYYDNIILYQVLLDMKHTLQIQRYKEQVALLNEQVEDTMRLSRDYENLISEMRNDYKKYDKDMKEMKKDIKKIKIKIDKQNRRTNIVESSIDKSNKRLDIIESQVYE